MLKTEEEAKIKEIKTGKAQGSDDIIPLTLLYKLSRELLDELAKFNNVIHDTARKIAGWFYHNYNDTRKQKKKLTIMYCILLCK